MMNAVLLTGHGGPDKLVYTRTPKPVPKACEVLIKVAACSINNTDINTRTGWYSAEHEFQELLTDSKPLERQISPSPWGNVPLKFPVIQGADVVGKVVEVGETVKDELIGKRVIVDSWIRDRTCPGKYLSMGSELNGGFAEFTAIPAENVCDICDSHLTDVQLAAIPTAYSTAENMLVKGRVVVTDTVLVVGASGGVGMALVQLGKTRKCTVIAVVGPGKIELAKKLGADFVYERNAGLFNQLARHKITVCMDVVGGPIFSQVMKVLDVGGRYVTAGAIGGPLVQLDLRHLIYKDLEMIGATRLAPDIFKQTVDTVLKHKLEPVIAQVFPLTELSNAQKMFQSKKFFGKIVMVP